MSGNVHQAEIIAYHGWGFDALCWKPLENEISGDIVWMNFDRGYFNSSKTPDFSDQNNTKIIVTHSFGLHLCDKKLLNKADFLIFFGGFLTFHPHAAQFKRRSKWMLNQMVEGFKNQPQQVLEAFYHNVFKPDDVPELLKKEMHSTLLLKDLKKLGSSEINHLNLKKGAKVCIFHGSHDAIVPKRKGRELYDTWHDQAQYFEIKEAGHALPFTHSKKCWALIHSNIVNT